MSIKLKNLPPSELIDIKAASTSGNPILPADTISVISALVLPILFASSSRSGTPATAKSRNSLPVNFPCVAT
uniref:Uncharacterized protein n=1 Tax=uncultured marine virus TaxID=186617 RepID=A0A0F7L3J9_9VIRU|nr:hypothetical protein B739_1374 [uncultured marine virus]